MTNDVTPKPMRCGLGHCPGIWKLENGRLLIVGEYAQQDEVHKCGAKVGPLEAPVIIPAELLDALKDEWIEEALKSSGHDDE